MTSEGPAPLLPRPGGGEAPAFVAGQDGHGRWRSLGRAKIRTGISAYT